MVDVAIVAGFQWAAASCTGKFSDFASWQIRKCLKCFFKVNQVYIWIFNICVAFPKGILYIYIIIYTVYVYIYIHITTHLHTRCVCLERRQTMNSGLGHWRYGRPRRLGSVILSKQSYGWDGNLFFPYVWITLRSGKYGMFLSKL